MRRELLGKQEKTQRSIKRLVDFIKLIQLRKRASSPMPSVSTSCLPQPSSSQSPQIPPSQTTQKATSLLRSSISSNNKTPCLATLTLSSTNSRDRVSPTFIKQKTRCLTPTSPAILSSQKSTNHILSSRKSPSRLEGPISLLAVKSKTKTAPQFSITKYLPVTLPLKVASTPSSPTPYSSTIVTTVKSRTTVQSQRSIASPPYQNCQILFSPSRTTTNWIELPSTAENPGPSSHAANFVSINQLDVPQKPYYPFTMPKTATSSCNNDQDQPDQSRKQQPQQRISTIVASTGQEPVLSSTRCSQAITSPIPSPVVHMSHEVQTIEIIRSCDSNFAVQSMNWSNNRANSQTSQQQSSSSGVPLRDSSNT